MLAQILLHMYLSPESSVWLFISWENLQIKTDYNINHLKKYHVIVIGFF